MSQQHLLIDYYQSVMVITLNRPDSLNSFSSEMILGLTDALKEAQGNDDVRAIVLTGAGRSFSAGGDVKTMGKADGEVVYEHIGKLNECILTMQQIEKPILAAVHGFAAGAGFNLALACDLIIAADDSKFALSFSKVGLISDGGGSYFLPRLIGPQLAKQFFFTAEPIPAERLYQLGVINQLVKIEALEEEVMKYATMLAQGPVKAYGMQKKIINHALTSTLDEILEQERMTQTLMITTNDHQEGIAAFKEKRKPIFQGK
ncbi:enoyl-CoA hydratase/isomerase family protein [Metabacillus iocasae]|uniref:2-(1,2-epoxy-1,2-dihydrophenyl)acetyl-CoA isomerase n=1 Tax=Priestia iocasae TaxID=2291674 RepID=A0ABS2QW80_9BACI|nr:enoyl-CoA hydratase-related protein [Metabacillus iocasae]MBM7703738.1 2-(1,2-epoxy-1,2-dihydrophenyl)acetyl-CoA isomerase [Metabacillus iocasae]